VTSSDYLSDLSSATFNVDFRNELCGNIVGSVKFFTSLPVMYSGGECSPMVSGMKAILLAAAAASTMLLAPALAQAQPTVHLKPTAHCYRVQGYLATQCTPDPRNQEAPRR
jgi:hypothetical protein